MQKLPHEDRHGEGREDTEQKARYEAVDHRILPAGLLHDRHADVHGPDARDADGLQIPQLSGNQRDEDDPRRLPHHIMEKRHRTCHRVLWPRRRDDGRSVGIPAEPGTDGDAFLEGETESHSRPAPCQHGARQDRQRKCQHFETDRL